MAPHAICDHINPERLRGGFQVFIHLDRQEGIFIQAARHPDIRPPAQFMVQGPGSLVWRRASSNSPAKTSALGKPGAPKASSNRLETAGDNPGSWTNLSSRQPLEHHPCQRPGIGAAVRILQIQGLAVMETGNGSTPVGCAEVILIQFAFIRQPVLMQIGQGGDQDWSPAEYSARSILGAIGSA